MKEIINQHQYCNWGTLHAQVFTSFTKLIEENNIKYFILRNYQGLPEENNSKDIDIIIEPGKYKKAFELLLHVFKNYDINNYRVVKYEKVRCCYGVDYDKQFSIHIDLIEGYYNKGFEIFTFDYLYDKTIRYKNFTVLRPDIDAVMLLLYKVISSKELKPKYIDQISLAYEREAQSINKIIYYALSEDVAQKVIQCLEKQDFDELVKLHASISTSSKKKAFLKSPIRTTSSIIKFLADKTYRLIWCPRKFQNFLAVEGPDGTGKSTFIEGLCKELEFYYVADQSKFHLYHFRPTILPNLGEVREKAKLKEQDKDFTNPHRAKPVGSINSFVRMLYYFIDYLIGVPLLLRKDVQFDKFTIYDRYIYDFLIDPKRSRINLPYGVRKLFTRLVMQPRLVFVLLTNAETIYKRKQELTMDEISRQLNEFSKLAASHERFFIIDAGLSPDEVVSRATKIVLESFTQKTPR